MTSDSEPVINMSDPDSLDFSEMDPYYPLTGEVLDNPMYQDATAWDMSEENVEVDQTPLQEQIQKNKECEYLSPLLIQVCLI